MLDTLEFHHRPRGAEIGETQQGLAMFSMAPMPGESCHLPHWLRIEGFPSPWVAWFSELICNNLESVTIVQVERLFQKHYNNLYNQNSHGPDPQSK